MAQSTPSNPFYQINGAPRGILDVATPFILAALFYCALRDRRSVQLHARYMLATPLPLIEPIAERSLGHLVPPSTSFDMDQFIWILRAAEVAGPVAALWLYALSPKYGRPFLIVAIAMIIQAMLVETVGMTSAWHALFVELGTLPTLPVLAAATTVGALTGWMGWTADLAPRKLKAATI